MTLFKCKMCGGTLEINNNETVATCEYCGTQQTLPKLDDDRKANLYDRANHFRRNNEFDKAMGIYEQILNEDNTDAEAYWSLVLCRYGIEYVEDPSSHKRIPTVNRAQFTSIFDDDNYKSALQYADGYQRHLYEEEAKAINEIQKGILAISQKEEPFDVFICYKETDNNGRRTPDSVLANDLYHQLTQEGFKVFFARITLEDKLGSAYEPYIFAALNSAKVMVVLGTKPEFFNAVWVKNEWSRYLALIKQGQKKMLIPAYKDMDPYDLPEEFSHLQAQDMSKLGFMQDLIRGIKKIAQADAPKATVVKETVIAGGNANTAPLLKRTFMFLEDGDWNSANEYCEKVLDIDPENASAYLGKLMAELHVKTQDALKDQAEPFVISNNYQKAVRFADEKLKTALVGYIEHINTRNENARLEDIYSRAQSLMRSSGSESSYTEAAYLFDSIKEYKDADELIVACQRKIEEIQAKAEADKLERERQAEIARKEAEKRAKRNIKIAIVTMSIVCVVLAVVLLINSVIIPNGKYNEAIALMDEGKYQEAISAFEALEGYKDSKEKISECNTGILDAKYNEAVVLMDAGKYTEAISIFEALEGYKDSKDKILECNTGILDSKYNDAIASINAKDYIKAYDLLDALGDYRDSAEKIKSIYDKYKAEKLKTAEVGDYIFFGSYEQDNNTSNGKEDVEWLVLEVKDGKVLVISKYALDCKQYNTSHTDVTWETCTLREWLNSDFINAAFSADEKEMIPTVTVSADKNPEYSTNPGNATQDQVFLLSITEANKYFSSDSARQCEPTDYAVANGTYVNSSNGNCWWWLRSPGYRRNDAAYVDTDGDVSEYGYDVNYDYYAVRPALWIDLNA